MKIISKIFLSPAILFALFLVPGLAKAAVEASVCNHTISDAGTFVTYYTLYKGDVAGLGDIDCSETPINVTIEGTIESGRSICFDPNPGFKISNWAAELGSKRVCTGIDTTISPNIEWKGDGDPTYPVPFTYTPSVHPDTEEPIGSASPISCTGGLEYNTLCSVNRNYRDQYVVETCPLSKYICPGHSQNLTSYEQYSVNIIPEVVFKEVIPGEVTVYGDDVIRGINRQTDQMTVPAPTSEDEANARIYWITENVTRCECITSARGVCTPIGRSTVSIRTGAPVYAASGPEDLNGEYSLTSDTTFTVECE